MYQGATFILFFVLIYALHDEIKYEINTLNSVSTHPLPPLEQCNGENCFLYLVLEGRGLSKAMSLYDGGVFSLCCIPTFKNSVLKLDVLSMKLTYMYHFIVYCFIWNLIFFHQ